VRCSALVELLETKLRKIIIGLFSVRTTENNSYVPYPPCAFFFHRVLLIPGADLGFYKGAVVQSNLNTCFDSRLDLHLQHLLPNYIIL